MSNFLHVESGKGYTLCKRKNIKVTIQRKDDGHLPDWIAINNNCTSIMVAEAKGCHPNTNLKSIVDRAWRQANRIEVHTNGSPIPLERIAIVSKWGFKDSNGIMPTELYIKHAKDNIINPLIPLISTKINQEIEDIYVSLFRPHIASLLLSFDSLEIKLARSILKIARSNNPQSALKNKFFALDCLMKIKPIELSGNNFSRKLVGGVVTSAGKLNVKNPTETNVKYLKKLGFYPYFVGFDFNLILHVITGNIGEIKKYIFEHLTKPNQTHFRTKWNEENTIPHPFMKEKVQVLYTPDSKTDIQTTYFENGHQQYSNFNGWTLPLGTGKYKIVSMMLVHYLSKNTDLYASTDLSN